MLECNLKVRHKLLLIDNYPLKNISKWEYSKITYCQNQSFEVNLENRYTYSCTNFNVDNVQVC